MKNNCGKKLLFSLIACMLLLLAACSKENDDGITSSDQLRKPGTKIGVSQSAPEEATLSDDFPDAEIIPYNDSQFGYKDVANGRIDAFADGREYIEQAIAHGTSGVRVLDETYCVDKVGIGISDKTKIPDLENRINEFIAEKKADGTLDEMFERWVIKAEDTMPEIEPAEDPQIHLRVGTTGILKPYSYYEGDRLAGHDIELAYRFAQWLGADVEFKVYDFGGVIAACEAGDVDCVMTNLYYTPARAEAIDFSDPVHETKVAFLVRDPGSGGGDSFFSSVKSSFEKTFIRDRRWKLFLSGIGTTLLITAMSILLGTLLGFVMFMVCRSGNRLANRITRICVWLVQGMPVVVLLMILYYIIFGKVEISGTLVAIAGFTLIFGAAVYSMLRTGTSAVDIGQTEAAYALGYTDRRTFYKVVLPQALPMIMPSFRAEVKALIKATAIVGYIAVQDLTKMGDIVRSRTYDAFFPLIAVAIIYYLLAMLLTYLVNKTEPKLNPRLRGSEKILEGVDTGRTDE